jgi:hypothetical protein
VIIQPGPIFSFEEINGEAGRFALPSSSIPFDPSLCNPSSSASIQPLVLKISAPPSELLYKYIY